MTLSSVWLSDVTLEELTPKLICSSCDSDDITMACICDLLGLIDWARSGVSAENTEWYLYWWGDERLRWEECPVMWPLTLDWDVWTRGTVSVGTGEGLDTLSGFLFLFLACFLYGLLHLMAAVLAGDDEAWGLLVGEQMRERSCKLRSDGSGAEDRSTNQNLMFWFPFSWIRQKNWEKFFYRCSLPIDKGRITPVYAWQGFISEWLCFIFTSISIINFSNVSECMNLIGDTIHNKC